MSEPNSERIYIFHPKTFLFCESRPKVFEFLTSLRQSTGKLLYVLQLYFYQNRRNTLKSTSSCS